MKTKKCIRLASGGGLAILLLLLTGSTAFPAPPTQKVEVVNTPLPVTVVGGEPVNAFNSVTSISNQVFNTVYTIPAGKQLIIEYISCKATVPVGETVNSFLINNPVVHFLVATPQATDVSGDSTFAAAQHLRVVIGPFADPRNVVVRMERNNFNTSATFHATLAGRLVEP